MSNGSGGFEDLSVLFWNVRTLFEPAEVAAKPGYVSRLEGAVKCLSSTFLPKRPDLIALCEVGQSASEAIRDRLGNGYWSAHYPSPLSESARSLGLGLICSDRLTKYEDGPQWPESPRSRRRSVLVRMQVEDNRARFALVVNHWVSDAYGTEADRLLDRVQTAEWLIRQLNGEEARSGAIVVGDFNADPSEPVFRQPSPWTTRYRAESKREETQLLPLYNTAWRFMPDPVQADGTNRLSAPWESTRGSYKYDANWYVVDQLLVSHQMLGGGLLELDEESVRYPPKSTATYNDGNGKSKRVSDHSPVMAAVRVRRREAPDAI